MTEHLEKSFSAGIAAALGVGYAAVSLPVLQEQTTPIQTVIASIILAMGLVALSAIDLKTLRLPDALTLPLAALGLGFTAALAWEPSVWWRLGAALAGYGFIWSTSATYQALRGRPGIGIGDAKLMAVAGAWLGFEGLPASLLYACAAALLYVALRFAIGRPMAAGDALPFGPFIAAGIWLVWLYGPFI